MNERMLKGPRGARAATAMIVGAALLLSACGPAATGPAAGGATATQVLKIGAAVALTGPVSKEGNLVKDGYEIWQKAVNDKGGLTVGATRYKVEFVFYDDESKADTASRLTESSSPRTRSPSSSGRTPAGSRPRPARSPSGTRC